MEMLWTWLLSFFFILTLLCILGYQLVCLVDLEFDHINPYDSSSRINNTVLPEFIIQGVLCVILLVTRHWFMLLLALPHLYYNVNSYMKGRHLVDVTEIYNQLSWEKKQRFFKIAYLLVLFILSLFWYCCFGALEMNTINHALFPLSSPIFFMKERWSLVDMNQYSCKLSLIEIRSFDFKSLLGILDAPPLYVDYLHSSIFFPHSQCEAVYTSMKCMNFSTVVQILPHHTRRQSLFFCFLF